MRVNFRKAFDALAKLGVPVYERSDMDGRFQISAEDPESSQWCDYYDSPCDWVFGVNPKLNQVLDKHGLYAEWINPGELGVYQI